MTDTRITIDDMLPPLGNLCAWGVRYWFRRQGLDFAAFLKDGVPASVLLATGDIHAKEVVAKKLERIRGQ